MKTIKTIPDEVAALIPVDQLEITRGNLCEFADAILRLQTALYTAYPNDFKKPLSLMK